MAVYWGEGLSFNIENDSKTGVFWLEGMTYNIEYVLVSQIKLVSRVLRANIKKIAGEPIAHIKKFVGVTNT
jgi:hypothetical protein